MLEFPEIRSALIKCGVTIEQLVAYLQAILDAYDEWAVPLPDSMAWKAGKPKHARECADEARAFAPVLGFNELEQAFFAVAFAGHDLGRMVQTTIYGLSKNTVTLTNEFRDTWDNILSEDRTGLNPDQIHGEDSVRILRPILGSFCDTKIGKWMLTAVHFHSFKDTPTLEMVGNDRVALAFACMLRDLDKVEGFRDARSYTSDPERKARERVQNWPVEIAGDSDWGTELGRIDPASDLDLFMRGEAINRRTCRSFESYMLQYLMWALHIVQPEMLELALAEGGPQMVATYLLKQLEATPDQRSVLMRKLEEWNDGALLKAPIHPHQHE
ncbi:MAG: hypothetical protein NUV81_03590 [bacterium]|nr:hypothetical protein [bacterium]